MIKNTYSRRRTIIHEAASQSSKVYIKVKPRDMAMFRFLLEGYDGLALFTVLENSACLLKVLYSPHQEEELKRALMNIQELVPLDYIETP